MAVSLVGCTHMGERHGGADNEQNEVKLPFAQLPPAVQDTLKREAMGAAVKEADKEMEAGKTIYEADVMIDGQNYEIKVAEDGKLISKAVDNEADEPKGGHKGEHAKKGGKEDKD